MNTFRNIAVVIILLQIILFYFSKMLYIDSFFIISIVDIIFVLYGLLVLTYFSRELFILGDDSYIKYDMDYYANIDGIYYKLRLVRKHDLVEFNVKRIGSYLGKPIFIMGKRYVYITNVNNLHVSNDEIKYTVIKPILERVVFNRVSDTIF